MEFAWCYGYAQSVELDEKLQRFLVAAKDKKLLALKGFIERLRTPFISSALTGELVTSLATPTVQLVRRLQGNRKRQPRLT